MNASNPALTACLVCSGLLLSRRWDRKTMIGRRMSVQSSDPIRRTILHGQVDYRLHGDVVALW